MKNSLKSLLIKIFLLVTASINGLNIWDFLKISCFFFLMRMKEIKML